MKTRSLTLLLLLLAAPLRAQEYRHLDQVYPPVRYESLAAWLGRAEALRTRILVSAGLWPLPERTPLHPRLSEPLVRDGYTIQNVVLETRPGFYLTGNLYRPAGRTGPHPAVLSAHGHWSNGRFEDSEQASVPGRAINFARQGYVVFTYSMVGYNETADVVPHRFDAPQYQLWGFSVLGLQLWNSLRALDFLSTLPDVDAARIGMTGASGGGTQTFLLTAIDPRVQVAAPVNMISAHMQGGCICENAPLLRLDASNIDIGALAAPRPLLLVSTSGDWTEHTPQVEFPAVQSVYRLFGAEDRVANVHLDYPHNYNRDSREAVYAWFARWLLGQDGAPKEQAFQVEASGVLEAELPARPLPLDTLFAQYAEAARQQVEALKPESWSGIYAYREAFGPALRHVLHAEVDTAGLQVETFSPTPRTQASEALLIVRPNHGAAAEQARALAADGQRQGQLVFVLTPFPGDVAPPDSIHHWTTYNATAAARRVSEIRVAAERILARPDVTALDLIGLEEAGPWTLLARALLPTVRRTTIDFNHFPAEADEAYLDRLYIPLLRRAGGFRTAAVLTAPAPLTLQNLPPGPLRRWIEDVYRAAGASDMVSFD